jgi:hypothetical protein
MNAYRQLETALEGLLNAYVGADGRPRTMPAGALEAEEVLERWAKAQVALGAFKRRRAMASRARSKSSAQVER